MIRPGLIILAFTLIAGAVAAQEIAVRSGAHDGFTRLTMNLPSRIPWRIEPRDNGADLIFESAGLRLDTKGVFDRIPRDRLAGLGWDIQTGTLHLSFSCPCVAKAFWHDRALLVLDIREGRDRPPAAARRPEGRPGPVIALPDAPHERAAQMVSSMLEAKVADMQERPGKAAARGDPPGATARQEMHSQLLQQFSRAATQGLLAPHDDLPDPQQGPPGTVETAGQDHKPETAERPAPAPAGPAGAQINLRAQSSIDRDFLETALTAARELPVSACLPPAQVDVASWGGNAPFGQQISALRLRLTGEFDAPDPAVVRDLARLYLYFGFGAEAARVLALLPAPTGESLILQQLAGIAEHGHAPAGSGLNGQLDCNSPAALWSALSYAELPGGLPMDTDAILQAFSALPRHLRLYYGPILSERFLGAGNAAMSRDILRILDRPGDTGTPDTIMAHARADLAGGADAEADSKLETVARSNSEPSPRALVEMIDARLARGQEVSYDLAQLAGAYAHEFQNDESGPELALAHIRALAASGAFDQSYDMLDRKSDLLTPAVATAARSEVLEMLAAHAEEVTFLRHALNQATQGPAGLAPAAANAAARRLAGLGFAAQAEALTRAPVQANRAARRERQLIRAEIALQRGLPRQALVELLGLTGDDVRDLRARALSVAGDHLAASGLFAASGVADRAAQEAWLGDDWKTAAETGGDVYKELARLKSGTIPGDLPEPGAVLARNQALLDASGAARNTLAALLAAHPAPDGPDSEP